ncbi:multidrug/spermidine efflux SMR transporter subunit MdtI [Desulfovibrio sp. OttesenSCG-928-C14]|nr:multidrug/spermidine efflux SMR transporter subunit MdtI [Desulfovibrio sp. OttesenSCG-928-C14]
MWATRKGRGKNMRNAELIHYLCMVMAVVLEVSANVFIKNSQGFKRKLHGFAGVFCVMAAFGALSQAVKGIDLSIAYAFWGGSGILLTMFLGQLIFRQKIRPVGWFGALLMVSGLSLLKMA